MNKYYMVYRIDLTFKEGRTLAKMLDVYDEREHIKGFKTRAGMTRFYEEFSKGFSYCMMLKPIANL